MSCGCKKKAQVVTNQVKTNTEPTVESTQNVLVDKIIGKINEINQ
jgi:hypothetical protein